MLFKKYLFCLFLILRWSPSKKATKYKLNIEEDIVLDSLRAKVIKHEQQQTEKYVECAKATAEAVADRMRSFLGCSSDCETDAKALGHMMNVRWHGRNSSVAAYR